MGRIAYTWGYMAQNLSQTQFRLGVVSYLNARPLIEGLDTDRDFELVFDVPARLPHLLDEGVVNVALVPVIDLAQRGRSWQIVSDACIGCDGETLTVRVFSRIPPAEVHTLHVDGDSHTSVVLAELIWRELYGRRLAIVPYLGHPEQSSCEAILLIGDKVVTNTLIGYDFQTDLGQAWKSLTSLPFVFAVWAAAQNLPDVAEIAGRLGRARDAGVRSAEMIAADFGPGMGWPVTLAKRYLTARLRFTLGERQTQGMARFLELAKRNNIIPDYELIFA